MSTAVKPKAPTLTQHAAVVAQEAADLIGLTDLKRFASALAMAAAEDIRRNPSFAARVRKLYDELAPRRATAGARSKPVAPDVELVPIRSMEGYEYDPLAPPDPYFLMEMYGPGQLRLALERYTTPRLQQAVKPVRANHPRTKPSGRTRQQLIDYIVERVAGA